MVCIPSVLLQGSPEVQGSKFVIGAIIPGSNNKATQEDVFVVVRACSNLSYCQPFSSSSMRKFGIPDSAPSQALWCMHGCQSYILSLAMSLAFVQIYLHYLPIRNGMKTREGLGLKDGVKWFTFWKGRAVVMADVTAM